jgi:hypothetical protein
MGNMWSKYLSNEGYEVLVLREVTDVFPRPVMSPELGREVAAAVTAAGADGGLHRL